MRRRLEWGFAGFCALLLAWLAWRDFADRLFGREEVNIELGLWSTRFLVAALAASPISVWLREPALRRLRRPLGLAAALFAGVHGVHYLIYANIWPDHMFVLVRRTYLSIGVVAFLLMLPLAATSTDAAVRRLSPKRWRALHRLVYPLAALTAAHGLMAHVRPMSEAGLHVLLIVGLLAWRVPRAITRLKGARRKQNGAEGRALRPAE